MLPDLAFFLGLERQVWEALRAGDGVADAHCLAPDFLGVYETGFADRAQHAALLDGGPIVADYSIEAARLLALGDDLAILCYRALYRPCAGATVLGERAMFVSSLWRQRDGRWLNVFSQDTPDRAHESG